MKLLFLSALSSNRLIEQLHKQSGLDPGFAAQKFNRLLSRGLLNNGVEMVVVSAPPVGRHNSRKLWWSANKEEGSGLVYHYLPFLNLPVIRQLFLTIGTYFKVWKMTKREKIDAP